MDSSLTVLLLIFGAIYIVPSIVAFTRSHPNRWLILVINIAAGLTILGWLLALLWALQAVHKSPKTLLRNGTDGGESGLNVFANDEQRVAVVNSTDRASQLRSLKELADSGSISPEEFALLKADVLKQISTPLSPSRSGGKRYI